MSFLIKKMCPALAPALTVFLLVVILTPSFAFLAIPKLAEASVLVHANCPPGVGLDMNCIKEYGLDMTLGRIAASLIIQTLTATIISTIQRGEGEFIDNFTGELKNQLDRRAGEFLNNLAGINLCNVNLNSWLRINLSVGIGSPLSRQLGCTLTGIVDNLQSFYDNFENGGWEAYFRVRTDPRYSQGGALIMAYDAKLAAESRVRDSFVTRFQIGSHFLGTTRNEEVCDDYDENGPICHTVQRTLSPGNLITETLNKTIGIGFDFAMVSDEINEAIETIINVLIHKLLTTGLELAR